MSKLAYFTTVVILLMCSLHANADDVHDSINEALEYYKEGSLNEASASLNYAAQLIQQKKSESMVNLLPAAPVGWVIDGDSSDSAAMGLFGGGISAQREYSKADQYVKVSLISDSPILQTVMMMFSNPIFATSDGGKLEKIQGQKAIVNFSVKDGSKSGSGEIKLVVDNRMLISIEGRNVSRSELTSFAEAIDYVALKKS